MGGGGVSLWPRGREVPQMATFRGAWGPGTAQTIRGLSGKNNPAINASIFHMTWLGTFSTALVISKCEKAGTEIQQLMGVYREDGLRAKMQTNY